MRVALYSDLLWHLHDLWPELVIPGLLAGLQKVGGPDRARRLARAEQTTRIRIKATGSRRLRELSHTINELEAEISSSSTRVAPQLLAEPGFGP